MPKVKFKKETAQVIVESLFHFRSKTTITETGSKIRTKFFGRDFYIPVNAAENPCMGALVGPIFEKNDHE